MREIRAAQSGPGRAVRRETRRGEGEGVERANRIWHKYSAISKIRQFCARVCVWGMSVRLD
jgi:hypothetical protein